MNPEMQALTPIPTPDQQGDESEKQWILDQFYGGISDAEKQIVRTTYLLEKQYQFLFAQNGNILEYPNWFQINRASVQDSPKSGANMLTALPKWIVSGQPYTTDIFIYCADGKMFSRDINGNYTYLFTAQDSQGNGLGQWLGYLYYTTNSSLGVYGPLGSSEAVQSDAYLTQGFNSTTNTGIAPINTQFSAVMVGHGNNLGKFDGTNWTANALTFAQGNYVRSLDFINQMLGIAVSVPGNIAPSPTLIYIWDGANYTFNAFVPADAPVDAILNWKNNLLFVMGSTGTIYNGMSPEQAQQRFPKLNFYDTISVLPGAVTKYKGQAMFGVAGSTTSSFLQQGVYHWGNRNDNYPPAMNYDYTISTGNTTNIQIGALFGSGQQLFIGWADNNLGTYGVDVVQPSNPYYSSAFVEGVIIDDLRPVDDKNALTIRASHLPLNPGETVQLAFKINRASSYMLSTVNSTVGSHSTSLRLPDNYTNFNELQCKFIIGSSGATTPTLTSIGAAYMPLLTESQY